MRAGCAALDLHTLLLRSKLLTTQSPERAERVAGEHKILQIKQIHRVSHLRRSSLQQNISSDKKPINYCSHWKPRRKALQTSLTVESYTRAASLAALRFSHHGKLKERLFRSAASVHHCSSCLVSLKLRSCLLRLLLNERLNRLIVARIRDESRIYSGFTLLFSAASAPDAAGAAAAHTQLFLSLLFKALVMKTRPTTAALQTGSERR